MRIPTSDGAGQRGTRRRGRGAPDPGSDRDTAGPDAYRDTGSRDTGRRHAAGNHADSSRTPGSDTNPPTAGTRTSATQYPGGPASGGVGAATASSVFAPGYDSSRAGDHAASARAGAQGSSSWYGSASGGAAGKGPVRGYPPSPGQPPPMYPPGQFAAWNVGQDSRSRPGPQPGPQDRSGFTDRPRRDGSQPDQASRQPAQPTAGSRYYDGSEADPGYSVLAVSDPAADVTSTQTWKAVGDGRSTGTWTAPARPGAGPGSQSGSPRGASGRHSAPPGAVRPDRASPGAVGPDPFSADPSSGDAVSADTASLGPARPDVAPGRAATDGRPRDRASFNGDSPDADRSSSTGRSSRSRSGAHSGPHATVRSDRGPEAEPRQSRAKSPAGQKRSASRKRPASVKLAISVALLLVLSAVATLAYTVLHKADTPKPASATGGSRQPKATPSPSQSPSLGPYGHIASRQSDPQPLTVAQLFPASFTMDSQAVTRAASAISRHCSGAISGSRLQSAVSSAHCDQALRATYLARAQGVMGTIGVLNLNTAARAVKAVKAADASDFINQLPGKHGPTRKIGNGTGIEEALAKGHYLILIWAEFTTLHKPRTAAQRTKVVNFMTDLLQNTANVSLANRMLTGSP